MITAIKKNSSLSEKVYHRLLERIISGRWQPGSFFDRRSVARELGVSIAPVSEAMIRLQQDGFIVTIPRKGTMLRPCDPRRLYENLILREAIECQAVRMTYTRLAEAQPELLQLAEKTDRVEPRERSNADAEFHLALIRLTGVEILAAQLEQLQLQVVFDELMWLDHSPLVDDPHVRLLAELQTATTPEAAAERMRHHLRCGRENLFQHFETAARPADRNHNSDGK